MVAGPGDKNVDAFTRGALRHRPHFSGRADQAIAVEMETKRATRREVWEDALNG